MLDTYMAMRAKAQGELATMLAEAHANRRPIELRDYQVEARDAVIAEWRAGRKTMVAMATGGGKTHLALACAEWAVGERLGRVLFIAHREELIFQPVERMVANWDFASAGIVMAGYSMTDAEVTVATIQTLSRGKRLDEILYHGHIGLVIVDECFPAGTLVDGRDIKDIAVGDYVTAFDEVTGSFHKKKVTRKFSKPLAGGLVRITVNGKQIVCTHEHPVYTQRGWVSAKEITENDSVVIWNGKNELRFLRPNVRSKLAQRRLLSEVGTRVLLRRMHEKVLRQSVVRNRDGNQSEIRIRPHESEQPYATERYARKSFSIAEKERALSSRARRERTTNAESSILAVGGVGHGMAGGIRCSDQNTSRARVSDLLQDRHSKSRISCRGRSGRKLAQQPRSSGAGREKNGVSAWARVGSVEVYQQGDRNIIAGLCPQGVVYNLEVEGLHTYTANGIVVHNCHHSASRTYRKVIDAIYADNPDCLFLGITATPRRKDEKGLSAIVDSVAYRLSIFDAIKRGILCPFSAKIAQMGFSLAGLKKIGDGWDDGAVEELMTAANALDVIVSKWQEECPERPTVAFTATVRQAKELAEHFNAVGVAAGFVSGETPKEERRKILSDYSKGTLQVVTTCGVLLEGWDSPHTSCVILARPTTSGTLMVQAIGRGMRNHPGKRDLKILQFVPMNAPIDLFMVGDLLGKPKKQQKAERKAKDSGLILDIFGVDVNGEGWEAEPDAVVMAAADLFATGKNRKLAWTFDPQTKIATLATGFGRAIGIVPPDPKYVEALRDNCDFPLWRDFITERTKFILYRMEDNKRLIIEGRFDTLDEAEAATREVLRKEKMWGKSRDAKWRSKRPTQGRRAFAQRLGVWQEGMNDGETSQSITMALFVQLVERERRKGAVINGAFSVASKITQAVRRVG